MHTSSSLRLEPLVVEAETGAGAGFVPSSVVGCEETYCLDTAEYPARDSLNTILDSDGGSPSPLTRAQGGGCNDARL